MMTNKEAFNILFGNAASSDNTIRCIYCDTALIGDAPEIDVVCCDCLSKFKNGVILRDSVVSFESAVYEGIEWNEAIPVTLDSHPEGYTCDISGDVFQWK